MAKDITETTPTPKPVSDDMVTIIIDHKETGGGIRINDVLYTGEVTVPKPLARQLMIIQQEYLETKRKLSDPTQKIRIKNARVIESQFLADPTIYGDSKGFSQELGLLDPWQWQFVPEPEKQRLIQLKKAMYGYNTNQL